MYLETKRKNSNVRAAALPTAPVLGRVGRGCGTPVAVSVLSGLHPVLVFICAKGVRFSMWIVSYPILTHGNCFTQKELKRLVAYARSSANLLNKLILQDQIDSYKWECLLRTPLNNYDAVILLHRDKLPYPQRLLFPSELNQGKHVARGNASKVFQPFMSPGDFKGSLEELKNKLLVNFDPLRFFVGDLEKEFSNMFKVWYDSLGGDAIGITWDRFSSKKRGREEGEDPVDVLKSVGQFGKGFVRSVYSLKSPRLMN